MTNADGIHDFTYDARGLVATQTIADEGVYGYGYDALGRSTTITYPDGHVRQQVFDDLGRVTSRCYEYPGDASLNRCYGAQYDAVGTTCDGFVVPAGRISAAIATRPSARR